jgi:hypothetical protein
MIGGLPGNSLVLVEFEERDGSSEIATITLEALGLDLPEGFEALLKLARKAMAVDEVGSW